jgi:hypothetical protein
MTRLQKSPEEMAAALREIKNLHREEWWKAHELAKAALAETVIEIDTIGGNCPVQAEGKINGEPFYFRARGERWALNVGGNDVVSDPRVRIEARYVDKTNKYEAGWMPESDARAIIERAARVVEMLDVI